MNQILSKEDLEARALNVNIHNHCMFLFASMLKRCHMGNYYRQRNAFKFRESEGNELPICDAVYSDDYEQVLVIEVKTRLIRGSQVDVNESIKVAILKELKPMLYSNYFIVPVFMYTTDQRDMFSFRDAKVMIYYGNDIKRIWTEPRTLASYYEDIKDSGSIHDLFNNLGRPQPTTLPSEPRCVKLEVLTSTPAKKTIERPKVSRWYKHRYFFVRYDQKLLMGFEHLMDIILDSGYASGQRPQQIIEASLSQMVATGALSLVVEYQGDMIELNQDMIHTLNYDARIVHRFSAEGLEALRESDKLIIFMNEKSISNKAEFKKFNEYMDSIESEK